MHKIGINFLRILTLLWVAKASSNEVPRNRLTDLLRGLDTFGNSRYLEHMSSFLDYQIGRSQHASGGGGGGGEARRRVNAHSPCECPDYMDTMEQSCLSRRHKLLGTTLSEMTGSSDAPENMRTLLRESFWRMFNRSADALTSIDTMHAHIFNGTKSNPPYLTQATNYAKALQNTTRFFLQFMDFIWSQEFIISELVQNDTDKITNLYKSALGQWTNFMNEIQRKQEVVTFNNYVRVANYLDQYTSTNANLMNIPTTDVYKALTSLSNSMEFNEDGTIKLRDSLVDSSNLVADTFSQVMASLSDTLAERSQSFPVKLSAHVEAPFASKAAELVTQFKVLSRNKIMQFTNSTDSMLESNQPPPAVEKRRSLLLTAIGDDLASVVDNHSSGRSLALNKSQEGTQVVTNNVSRLSDSVATFTLNESSILRSSLSFKNAIENDIKQLVSSTEKRLLSNSSAYSTSGHQNANDQIQNLYQSTNSSATRILNQAAMAVFPIIDSVGVAARSGSDSIGAKVSDMSSEFAEQSHGFSMDSASVSGDIWRQMLVANGRIDSASLSVSDQINSDGSSVFKSVAGNLWADPSTGKIPLQSVEGSIANREGNSITTIDIAGDNMGSRHLKAASDAEIDIDAILENVKNSALSSKEKIALIRRILGSHLTVPNDDLSLRTSLGTLASNVGDDEEKLAALLGQTASQLSYGNQHIPLSLSQTMAKFLSDNANELTSAQSRINDNDQATSLAGTDYVSALNSHQNTIGTLEDSLSNFQSSRSLNEGFVTLSSRQIDSKLAERSSGLAALYSADQYRRIQSARYKSEDGIHQSATNAMTGIRTRLSDQDQRHRAMLKYILNQQKSASQNLPLRERLRDQISDLALKYAVALDNLADTSALPVSSPQVSELSGDVYEHHATAHNALENVQVAVNVSANSLLANMSALIQNYIDLFKAEEAKAETALNAVNGSITQSTVMSSSITGLNSLKTLSQSVSDSMDSEQFPDQTIPSISGDLDPAGIPSALLSNQSRISALESSIVSNLSQKFYNLNHSLTSDSVSTIQSQFSKATQNDAINSLKTQIKNSAINQTLVDTQRLSKETNEMMQDYRRNLMEQMDMMRSKPQVLFNQVTATKALMKTAMGRLQATLAQSISENGASMSSETGATALMTKYELNALRKMFETFAAYSSGEKFKVYLQQLHEYMTQTVGTRMVRGLDKARKHITRRTSRFEAMRAEVMEHANEIEDEYEAVENQRVHLIKSVNEWSQNQQQRLAELNSSFSALKSQTRNTPDPTNLVSAAISNMTQLIVQTFPEYAENMTFNRSGFSG